LEIAASRVLDERDASPPGEQGEVLQFGSFRKTDDPVVARVDSKDESRVVVNRILVIREPGLVRSSDLGKNRAALSHDCRDPEGAADLNQLAS